MGASKANVEELRKYLGISIISYDKMNQLRHVKFFGTFANMQEHMKKHKAIIAPKFELVCNTLERELPSVSASGQSPRAAISYPSTL